MISRFKLSIFTVGIALFVLLLMGRLFYLQVIKHDFFKEKSQNQLLKLYKLYPHRGNIYDRHQRPLALARPGYSAYAIPSAIKDKKSFAKSVTHIVGGSYRDLEKRLGSHPHFVWVKRKLDRAQMSRLKALKLSGINFIQEEKRIYPLATLGANVLGFVGIDNQGLGGIEYLYDGMLKGSPGRVVIEGDPRGYQLVSGKRTEILPYDGGHISLTIDASIQYHAERFLAEGIRKQEAKGGYVVVLNPKNGDILAMANVPTFNPNSLPRYGEPARKNGCITDVFEPGSVFKLVTVASVLEEGLVKPDTVLTVPETLTVYNRTIKEAHEREEGDTDQKSVTDIITESLNVGTTLLAERLGKPKFYRYMRQFGFGELSGVEFPGEVPGLLRKPRDWSGVDIAMMSFGQGLAVTPLQMTAAVGALVNDGVLIKPRLVKYLSFEEGASVKGIAIHRRRRVISSETSEQVKEIMKQVVETGTGMGVRIPGLSIGGKTGTAQKARKDGLGYEKGAYIASFIGFFPVEDPEIVMLVAIDSPQKQIWGSSVAGPVFRKTALFLMDYLNIYSSESKYY